MGVPKFYFWLSQRYPSINENVDRLNMPAFDNLYMDMNGVFHTCSHPDDDVQSRLTEAEIFENIATYIDFLFNLVQPRKLLFLSVDGVAPRSKMNQQRSRRFKTAKEAIEKEAKARRMGEVIPPDSHFDSNCITPGTEFMHNLHKFMVQFLNDRVQNNNAWKNVEVLYSGYDVPGEGEHKIMDYIRYCKTQNKFSPDVKHCLYGLDADLIHLGLCSHEPYFSLLREKVILARNQKRHCDPFKTEFQLLHLSILRDYIFNEFKDLIGKLKFEFDLDKIIDDWILINFLIGNDFLPHIPKFHILKGGIPLLYETYKEVIVQLDGYINVNGHLNLRRYQKFLEVLSEQDLKLYDPNADNGKYYNDEETFGDAAISDLDMADGLDNLDLDDDSDYSEMSEFTLHKNTYYKSKLHFEDLNGQVLEMANEYVKGIQWVLHYYYNGCVSWNWYYPYYYGPFVSDLAKFDSSIDFNFQLNEPFLPLVQLLSVIPQASRQILPKAFQPLTTDSDSPLIDFFPKEYGVDLNEKIHDYEAIILIPFVNEELFLKVFHDYKSKLTPGEVERNKFGHYLSMIFSEQPVQPNETLDSSLYPNVLAKKIRHDFYVLPPEIIFKGIRTNVDLKAITGFPTLNGIEYRVKIENSRGGGMYSYPTMVLHITSKNFTTTEMNEILHNCSGKMVYINWPLLSEAKLLHLFDRENKYSLAEKGQIAVEKLSPNEQSNIQTLTRSYCHQTLRSKGVSMNEAIVVAQVAPLQSQHYQVQGAKVVLLKEWANTPLYVPMDLILYNVRSPYRKLPQHVSFCTIFTKQKSYYLVEQPYYGYKATVVDYDQKRNLIHAKIRVTSEPDFQEILNNSQYILTENYINEYKMVHEIRSKLKVSDICIKRLLGSVLIEYKANGERDRRLNIGLKLKYKSNAMLKIKPYCIPGYSMEKRNEIFYSYKVISLFEEYHKQFPFIFGMFSNASKPIFTLEDALPHHEMSKSEKMKKLTSLKNWLASLDIAKIGHFKSTTAYLDNCIVKCIEETIESHSVLMEEETVAEEILPPVNFYIPEFVKKGNTLPDSRVKFFLFDRVVNIKTCISVPYGLKGTVIGIYKPNDEFNKNENNEVCADTSLNTDYPSQLMSYTIEVLFDEPFDGGLALRSTKKNVFKMNPGWLINITYGLINATKRPIFSNVYKSIQYSPKKGNNQQQQQVRGQQQQQQHSYSQATTSKAPVPQLMPAKSAKVVNNRNNFNHSETSPFKILKKLAEPKAKPNGTAAAATSPAFPDPSALNVSLPPEWIVKKKTDSNRKQQTKTGNKTKKVEIVNLPNEIQLSELPIPFGLVDSPVASKNTSIPEPCDSNDASQKQYIIPTLTLAPIPGRSSFGNQQQQHNYHQFTTPAKQYSTRQFYNKSRNYPNNNNYGNNYNNYNNSNYNNQASSSNNNSLSQNDDDVKQFVPLQVAMRFQQQVRGDKRNQQNSGGK